MPGFGTELVMSAETSFDRFEVGDHAVFDRMFQPEDFAQFAKLSGDSNPLHFDRKYAETHGPTGVPIVPLHLTIAPLSMIAGMIFPGEPSLYLGHELHAYKPVMYGEAIRYSARIEAINRSHRILTVRVLALRDDQVVLDATMRVQARVATWQTALSNLVRRASKGRALVTGAGGEIGSSVAIALAKAGWKLLLHDREAGEKRQRLQAALSTTATDAQFLSADLDKPADLASFCSALRGFDDLSAVIHTASPRVDASVENQVAVNFTALKEMAAAVMPSLLARQDGAILLIGSSSVRASIVGWEAYSGAKAMAMNLIDSIDRRYSAFGVRAFTLAPGFVATEFSQQYRSASAAVLLPGEVAEAALAVLADRAAVENTLFLEPGRATRGRYPSSAHPSQATVDNLTTTAAAPDSLEPSVTAADTPDLVSAVVRKVLRLPAGAELRGGGLGVTAGWDSLKHIEIILSIETELGLRFTSAEIETTHNFDDLKTLCSTKLLG
jgi:short-subunit dehydrogenase/acyl dehydratase